mmetsp:Transcript_53374/g.134017  ORF Transcript_53374/g.134017 Transcript_53374/m.134017 type:complete len:362 (+) Transcript_53374:785-1870(+)
MRSRMSDLLLPFMSLGMLFLAVFWSFSSCLIAFWCSLMLLCSCAVMVFWLFLRPTSCAAASCLLSKSSTVIRCAVCMLWWTVMLSRFRASSAFWLDCSSQCRCCWWTSANLCTCSICSRSCLCFSSSRDEARLYWFCMLDSSCLCSSFSFWNSSSCRTFVASSFSSSFALSLSFFTSALRTLKSMLACFWNCFTRAPMSLRSCFISVCSFFTRVLASFSRAASSFLVSASCCFFCVATSLACCFSCDALVPMCELFIFCTSALCFASRLDSSFAWPFCSASNAFTALSSQGMDPCGRGGSWPHREGELGMELWLLAGDAAAPAATPSSLPLTEWLDLRLSLLALLPLFRRSVLVPEDLRDT